jgi:hypothetical protein
MHGSLPSLKYNPLSLTLHCHKVPLFVIQSLLYSSDSLAHLSLPCVSSPFKCKYSAHPKLSAMITALVFLSSLTTPSNIVLLDSS